MRDDPEYTIAESLRENYPTGRKHCSRCGRWRLIVDFYVKTPTQLQSWCKVCQRIYMRKPGGYGARVPENAEVVAQRRLAARRARYAERMREIKADPARHKEYLEDQRIRAWDARRARGAAVRPRRRDLGRDKRLDRAPLDAFLAQLSFTSSELSVLTGFDESYFRARGRSKVRLSLVDTIFSRLGLPDQVAVLWPYEQEVNPAPETNPARGITETRQSHSM